MKRSSLTEISFLTAAIVFAGLLGARPARSETSTQPLAYRNKLFYKMASHRSQPKVKRMDAAKACSLSAKASQVGLSGEAAALFRLSAEVRDAKLEKRAARLRGSRPAPLTLKPGLQSGRPAAALLERRAKKLHAMALEARRFAEEQSRLAARLTVD